MHKIIKTQCAVYCFRSHSVPGKPPKVKSVRWHGYEILFQSLFFYFRYTGKDFRKTSLDPPSGPGGASAKGSKPIFL